MNLRDLVPAGLIERLRDRYLAGVSDAEERFSQDQADEDSLTGALGASIATRRPLSYSDPSGRYEAKIVSKKIRGRGPGAPEKVLGADGIFEIEVRGPDGMAIQSKGLPFQAKKNGMGGADTVRQANRMLEKAGAGLVIDFSRSGYRACNAKDFIAASGRKDTLDSNGSIQDLGHVLADGFLGCTIGVDGLFYSDEEEQFAVGRLQVISTTITKVL